VLVLPSIDTSMEIVVAVAILAVFVERALSIVFEHPWYIKTAGKIKGLKEVFALLLCYGIVKYLGFDVINLLTGHPGISTAGLWISAAVIAGGSKGSAKLFVEMWDIQSNASRGLHVQNGERDEKLQKESSADER
jgi:hypothetical protein